jgi:hypothetical protein
MPNEIPQQFHHFELVVVHFSDDPRRPVLVDQVDFLYEVQAFVSAHLVALRVDLGATITRAAV